MRARKLLTGTAALAVGVGLFAGPVAATPAAPALEAQLAAVEGNTATVTGAAEFDEWAEAVVVGGTPTGGNAAHAHAGLQLEQGLVEPLPNGLRFIWKVEDLPEQVPPEGVRYTWTFKIGEREYQLQAKRTNLASVTTTEDPQGHLVHATTGESWFQLRGACTPNYLFPENPVAGCYHLAFLKGGFDAEANTVHIDLPWDTKDRIGRSVAPDFVPGAAVVAHTSASMSIAAGFQAVVSSTATSRYINDWMTVYTAPVVHLGVGRATASPASANYSTTAELADDGTFSGTVSGLTATNNAVFARACLATVCTAKLVGTT